MDFAISRGDYLCWWLLQPLFVGLYALKRLHCLFARNKVSNGYSNTLFVGMLLTASAYAMSVTTLVILNAVPKRCGWRTDNLFHYECWYLVGNNGFGIWHGINMAVYLSWDLIVLLLFVFKMHSISSGLKSLSASSGIIAMGIRKQMMRIIILTILYMVSSFVDAVWFVASIESQLSDYITEVLSWNGRLVIEGLVRTPRAIVTSYAVYLMQGHNSMEYVAFLKRVTFCKLHFCCCCNRLSVLEQLEFFKSDGSISELKEQLLKRQDSRTELVTAYGEFSLDEPPESH